MTLQQALVKAGLVKPAQQQAFEDRKLMQAVANGSYNPPVHNGKR